MINLIVTDVTIFDFWDNWRFRQKNVYIFMRKTKKICMRNPSFLDFLGPISKVLHPNQLSLVTKRSFHWDMTNIYIYRIVCSVIYTPWKSVYLEINGWHGELHKTAVSQTLSSYKKNSRYARGMIFFYFVRNLFEIPVMNKNFNNKELHFSPISTSGPTVGGSHVILGYRRRW